jgi:prolyl-tRNA editing enzyme YbaK/EbsC (Cys-tRNA(Pro) deacylase)
MIETDITRLLVKNGVQYKILPQVSGTIQVEDAAKQRGISTSIMVKCIALRDMSNRYALACVPGDKQVDPKKVRSILGWRRMTCVDKDDVLDLTGFALGTVSPIKLATPMTIVFDRALSDNKKVTISSGDSRAGLLLDYLALETLASPLLGDISRD